MGARDITDPLACKTQQEANQGNLAWARLPAGPRHFFIPFHSAEVAHD